MGRSVSAVLLALCVCSCGFDPEGDRRASGIIGGMFLFAAWVAAPIIYYNTLYRSALSKEDIFTRHAMPAIAIAGAVVFTYNLAQQVRSWAGVFVMAIFIGIMVAWHFIWKEENTSPRALERKRQEEIEEKAERERQAIAEATALRDKAGRDIDKDVPGMFVVFANRCDLDGLPPPDWNIYVPTIRALYEQDIAQSPAALFPILQRFVETGLQTTSTPEYALVERYRHMDILTLTFSALVTECFLPFARRTSREHIGVTVPAHTLLHTADVAQIYHTIYDRKPDHKMRVFIALYDRMYTLKTTKSVFIPANKKFGIEAEFTTPPPPENFVGTTSEAAYTYFSGTPLHRLFSEQMPLPVAQGLRLEHQFILAPSGQGKTQFIQAMIAEDLKKVAAGEASILVIESQGLNRRETNKRTLVENLIGLKAFAHGLKGKLAYVTPNTDMGFNIFDMGQNNPGLTKQQREIREAAARNIIMMSLGAGSDLQYQMLSWCVELALLTDNPTIHTLLDILKETDPQRFQRTYGKALKKSDSATLAQFFDTFVKSSTRNQTKDALLARITGLLSERTARAMFEKPTNDFRMIDELEAGKVIVVDAELGRLGDRGTEAFGRFFIAQLVHASRQRQSTKPVYVYLDECHYFVGDDENISILLREARKQDIGLVFATQELVNIKSSVVRELLQKVAIVATHDEAKPKMVFDLKLRGRPDPIEVNVPPLVMEKMPRMTDAEYAEVHKPKTPRPPPPQFPPPPPVIDRDPDAL